MFDSILYPEYFVLSAEYRRDTRVLCCHNAHACGSKSLLVTEHVYVLPSL